MTRRGTTNSAIRGSSFDRRARRLFLLLKYGIPRKRDGVHTRISCAHCGKVMRADGPWEVDRSPRCGHDGGRYTRDNIVPACSPCNRSRCKVKGCRGGGGRASQRPRQRPADFWSINGPAPDPAEAA